ncbi:cation:proton antiporter [Chloroflexota bacterium]
MSELLIAILVLIVIARITGELMQRLGQLAILGELIAGIVIGILITYGPISQFDHLAENEVFGAFTSLGMFLLMLMAGMEMDVEKLIKASKTGVGVAIGGMILPLGLGYLVGHLFLPDSTYKFAQSFFIGVSLSITAIPALSRVLVELGQMDTRLGRTLMNAAIVDDVLGLFLLAILTSMIASGGTPSAGEMLVLALKIIGFFVFVFLSGKYLIHRIGRMSRLSQFEEIEFSIAIIIALVFGVAAEYAGMHFIIGALFAGMFLREETFGKRIAAHLEQHITGITLGFLAPLFFISIGLHLNLSALTTAPMFVFALLLAAILGKVLGCGIPALLSSFRMKESLAIGIGMNGRGAVEIVVAVVALKAGLFSHPVPTPSIVAAIFSSVVIMTIITTILVPIGMKPLLKERGA